MDIINHLIGSDVKNKTFALENLSQKVNAKPSYYIRDLPNESRMRLITCVLNCIKETNIKIVTIALNLIKLFLSDYKDYYVSFINMTFDVLISKFGDSKVSLYNTYMFDNLIDN